MIRLLLQGIVSLIANAIGLLAASYFLDGFEISGVAFISAVVIFTLATFIFGPLVAKIALTSAPFLMGGIALVTIIVGLFVTTLFSDGIMIHGLSDWVLATLIIWIFSLIANVIVPLFVFKKAVDQHQENKNPVQPAA